jgi:hypothetical protein
MSKVNKIYLDMDGVICDFHKRYREMFSYDAGGEGMENSRDRKEFSKNWKQFVGTNQFETLDWFPGGLELVEFVKTLDVRVEILSSSGGIHNHSEVRDQKISWLRKNGIFFPVNIVPGRRVKKYFALPSNILIDDMEDVIDRFNENHGIGILHKDVNVTISRLKELL